MAKGAGFHRGSSGSPKHTEVSGAEGFDGGHVGPDGPRIGPGPMARKVTAEYSREKASPGGEPKVRNMSRISQGE